MSGLASILLAALGAVNSGSMPPWTFWIAATACIVIASFRVWLKECKGRETDAQQFNEQQEQLDQRIS